jgi:hypothetical protein
MKVMHEMVLMKDRIRELEESNEALSKRRKAKKRHVRAGGPLTMRDASNILAEKDLQAEQEEQMRAEGGRAKRRVGGVRHCGNCGKTGHNSRTCQEDIKMDGESDSE